MGTPSAPFLDFAGEVKRAVDIPVMHASRIADVATARYAIREGLLDLVGMTRAQIADPHLVRQARRGGGGPDPAVRRRQLLPRRDLRLRRRQVHAQPGHRPRADDPARGRARRRRGGARRSWSARGPAGLEAARVLGERGHEVVAARGRDRCPAGRCGSPRRAPAPPRPDRHRRLAGRRGQAHAASSCASASTPRPPTCSREHPDLVVVATGGLPDRSFLDAGAGPGRRHLGRHGRRRAARPGRSWSTTTTAPSPASTPPSYWPAPAPRSSSSRPERTLAPDVGSMNSPGVPEGLRRARRDRHAGLPAPPGATGAADGRLRRHPVQRVRRGRGRARRRPRRRRARHAAQRRALPRPRARLRQPRRGRPRRPCSPGGRSRSSQPGRPATSCSASATPSPAATSTPRSTTRCACAYRLNLIAQQETR